MSSAPTTESPGSDSTTAGLPRPLPLPPRLFVPIADDLDCPPAGTRVRRGQVLGAARSGVSWNALASAGGTIVGATEVERIGAGRGRALEISVDEGEQRQPPTERATAAPAGPPAVPATGAASSPPSDLRQLIDALRASGVQSARHTSPDLLAQLESATARPVDTVLCSLLDPAGESELHASVFRGYGDVVVAGIDALSRLTGARRTWCAADTRASSANRAIRRANLWQRIKVIEIANDYPQADPSLLIYSLLRRRLKPGRLPTEANVLLLDGLCAAAIGKCVLHGQPMLDVAVEIRESERSACTVRTIAVGTPLRFVLEHLWLKPERLTLRAGTALRDLRITPDAVFDGVGEVSIDVGPPSPTINPDPCIRCGWCVEACPVSIHPAGILEAAQDHDRASARWYGLESCIECGICSYVCPSRLPLLEAIRDFRQTASTSRD